VARKRAEVRLPLLDRFTLFREVGRLIVDFSDGAHNAIGLIENAPEFVIEQPLDDMRQDT
jgi:hypothetical protein